LPFLIRIVALLVFVFSWLDICRQLSSLQFLVAGNTISIIGTQMHQCLTAIMSYSVIWKLYGSLQCYI